LADDINLRKRVERQILLYLRDHPAAADTAEGVRHWWLRGLGELSQTMVTDALGELLRLGWLTTRSTPRDSGIFALNEREAEALERFLSETGDRLDG
jgi:DNA-binding PadR family transcriptional regulator